MDVLPSAPDAERGLCARILRHPPTLANEARPVRMDDFIDNHHRSFFAACRELHFAGEPIDPMLLAEKLAGRGPFTDKASVAIYMGELDAAADNADAAVSVRLIREAAHKRRVRATCETAIKATANGQASSSIINDLQSDLIRPATRVRRRKSFQSDHRARVRLGGVQSQLSDRTHSSRGTTLHPGGA